MSKISVVMPAYNAKSYIAEAMESVLNQSFEDFEFIIIDDGSKDTTLSIIHSYADPRIRIIENRHDFIGSLNMGISASSGKYIARMDADDRMHIDRLRIQYALMEENPTITVCSSWISCFGENVTNGIIPYLKSGLLECPLLTMLKWNTIIHPSVMMRADYLHRHALRYEKYDCAEDYKLWVEIAKSGGQFYIEPQPLLYYRVSEGQVSNRRQEMQAKTSNRIKTEVLNYLIDLNRFTNPSLREIYSSLSHACGENILNEKEIFDFFFRLLTINKNSLVIGSIK